MTGMDKKKEVINNLKELKDIWLRTCDLVDEIGEEDKHYNFGAFAERYPFEMSFDEYPFEIEEWIDSLEESYKKEVDMTKEERNDIVGIVFEHGNEDWGLWLVDAISKEDQEKIQEILMKYSTEGCSIRNVYKELVSL